MIVEEVLGEIANRLATSDYVVIPDFLAPDEIEDLARDFEAAYDAGELQPARVGRGEAAALAKDVRRDSILWFEEQSHSAPRKNLWNKLSSLREVLNQTLYLGLKDLEGHYAIYEPGAFYARHLDRFRDDDLRTVSVVLYLNRDWQPEDGGQLRLFSAGRTIDCEPRAGTLVCFISASVEHEVLESKRARRSFAGWFRRRAI